MAVNLEEAEPDYKKEREKVRNTLEKNEWQSTPEIATETYSEEHAWGYWRYQLLPGILRYERKLGNFEKKEEPEGGRKTHYWRLSE